MNKFLDPDEYKLEDVFKGKYNIPIYQRPYSWAEVQVKTLLEDVENNFIQDGSVDCTKKIFFAGTMFVTHIDNIKNSYNLADVVDGQQRITTFTLILMKILDYYYSLSSEDVYDIVRELEQFLWKKESRIINKELRVLELGNIDKKMMKQLFDVLYKKGSLKTFALSKLKENTNDIERNLLKNYLVIDEYFTCKFKEEKNYYDYLIYIKNNVRFIVITVNTSLVKLFSIFESINSKGKALEEIDLIKSYIFQNIQEENYAEYLGKWGELITKTNDKLMDYLIVYIRANISYYKNNIKLSNFKYIVENSFSEYFNVNKISDALTRFVDDLLKNVKYYNYLANIDLLEKEFSNRKVLFEALAFLKMNRIMDYKHTKALYFKLFILRENNKLPDDIFKNIIKTAFKYIYTIQSVSSKESKATLSTFVNAQSEFYKLVDKYDCKENFKNLDDKIINNYFIREIQKNNITKKILKNNLKTNIKYSGIDKAVRVLLGYLENLDPNNCTVIDYSKIYWLLKMGKDIHIDHIIPRNPKKDDSNFKFYIEDNLVFFKLGQDFVQVNEPMDKMDFYDKHLNVLGNLKLEWANDNIKKTNQLISLRNFDKKFNTNSKISDRTLKLINLTIDSGFLLSKENTVVDLEKENNINIDEIKDFSKKIEYKNYKPIKYSFLDEEYILDKKNYTNLLLRVVYNLWSLDSKKMNELAEGNYRATSSKRIYVTKNKENLRESGFVSSNVYVEINLSSEYIVKFLYKLMQEFELNNNDLVVYLEQK